MYDSINQVTNFTQSMVMIYNDSAFWTLKLAYRAKLIDKFQIKLAYRAKSIELEF